MISSHNIAAVIKSDESVLLKNNPIELNLSGTAVITEYSLEQTILTLLIQALILNSRFQQMVLLH